ncbi:hypothetical protein E2C01_071791 [Portunus trituberculatus]|uniref:Uncharacterized protein n=1 Tax=Portunus trituberculatus TaxID=210409 RepID=A0A5B7I618_PORTR|nr:hypothetical protein [Portunus trituberculatus]
MKMDSMPATAVATIEMSTVRVRDIERTSIVVMITKWPFLRRYHKWTSLPQAESSIAWCGTQIQAYKGHSNVQQSAIQCRFFLAATTLVSFLELSPMYLSSGCKQIYFHLSSSLCFTYPGQTPLPSKTKGGTSSIHHFTNTPQSIQSRGASHI